MALHQTTDSTFDQDVLQSTTPVIVDFWAEWCGPCRMLLPILEEAAPELEGKVKIVKVNLDQNPQTAARFNVRSIPTLIMFKNGQMQSVKVGLLSKPKLVEWATTGA